MASGCLGLIYLCRFTHRSTRQQINKKYPNLIQGLLQHPGIEFLLVAEPNGDASVISAQGTLRLSDGQIQGINPLQKYPVLDKTVSTQLLVPTKQ